MASDWRGYRLLILDERRFLWACDFNDPLEVHSASYAARGASWPPDRLLVRPESGTHRLLTVRWPACRGPIVVPRLVRACVEEALRRGWLDAHDILDLAGETIALPPAIFSAEL